MANRLADATSPYLRQHADNPVDWWEWGPDAFAEARRRDLPVLISVGYAACHWCHVMAHESFEDPEIAAFMRDHVVAVKVDREERPDVDATYMAATIAMSGQGGWPMTVLATPDGTPFFAGTYFPPVAMGGVPSFRQLLEAAVDAWRTRRADLVDGGAQVVRALAARTPALGTAPLDRAVADAALSAALAQADPSHGGFGRAPKFPPSMLLEWLLRRAARGQGDRRSTQALDLAGRTLEAMARGGMYDQVGGGFARYSVDAAWVVPHFEKMLYDNALLLRVYAHWWRLTRSPLARRVVEETADFLLSELRTPEGGFASSLDADSLDPGTGTVREGAFYVWTPEQLVDALGAADGTWVADLCRVFDGGSFEHGTSVLRLPADPDDPERWLRVRDRLRDARAARPRPTRDDKVVTAWNGLTIAALADAGALFDRRDWVEAARTAADHVLATHLRDAAEAPRLARSSLGGRAGAPAGVLEDYACLAEGLLAVVQAVGDPRYLTDAERLLDAVREQFTDDAGILHDTAADATDPVIAAIRRPREVVDGPTPSGTAAAGAALLTYAALTGLATHRRAAEQALGVPLLHAPETPLAAGWALAALEAALDGPRQVAVVGDPDDPRAAALRSIALAAPAPGLVIATGEPDAAGLPLLAGRPLIDGAPAAYVCRGFVCDRPTGDPDLLGALLNG
ncbi:thioredoxin domain-containing protein [Actinotalea sp. M2MS4P-6]|uniref:thioredoxin domain-containing protein n=1 Tax=Actinotalea sp. M2MS4P-6 TaxID=2983762 RepID=UPI0021E36572|nr:thioredoxin domain-containing protein [Actinotalea sp. M2MS4P-6]MCV2394668.1 thioredoxin domain-containing protein [Actinotalea sp. M2MS4P-6]